MTDRLGRPGLLLRHYAASPWRSPIVAVVVALAAFAVVAAPAAAATAATAELRTAVGDVRTAARDLVAESPGGVVLDSGPADRLPDELAGIFGATDDALERIRSDAGERLTQLLGTADYLARSTPMPILPPADADRDHPIVNARIAVDPLLDDRLRLVDGRRPVGMEFQSADPIEVLASVETATAMRWEIGDTRRLPTISWPLVLVGTFEAADPGDRMWAHVDSVLEPQIVDDGNRPPNVTGTVFVAPESLAATPIVVNWRLTAWYPLADLDLDLREAEALVAELRSFTTTTFDLPVTEDRTGAHTVRFDSAALDAIEAVLARSTTSSAVLALIATGPLGVVLAVLALTATGVVAARRPVLLLAASRGASGRALRAALGLEGALVGIPAAAVGVIAALLLVPGPVSGPALVGAGALAVIPAVVFAARATPPLRRVGRDDLSARGRPLRIVVELLVLGVAALATVLLLVRGPLTDAGTVDPLAVTAPVALAVAGAVLLRRLLPAPLLALQRRARRRPQLATFVGFARAVREPLGAGASLALVVAVAVAVFSSAMLSTITAGTANAVRSTLGAEVRVEGPPADAAALEAIAALPGVAELAGVERAGSVVVLAGGDRETADLLLVDAAGLAALHPSVPIELAATDDDVLPALLSPGLAADLSGDRLRIGDVDARSVGIAEESLGLGGGAWVAVDGAASSVLAAGAYTPRTILIGLEPGASGVAVGDAVGGILGPTARVTTVDAAVQASIAAPTLSALRTGFGIAVGASALLVALAVSLAALVATARRRELLDRLAVLGADRRQLVATIVAESAPPALGAVVVGVALGLALPFLVVAGTDLGPLVGGTAAPPVVVDPISLAVILLSAVLVAAASLLPAILPVLRRSRGVPT